LNTGFSEHEAEQISDLSWYNDKVLNNIIIENYSSFSIIDKDSWILDIGCGVGLMCNELQKIFKNYTGIDNSIHMINKAWKKDFSVCNNIEFIEIDILSYLESDIFPKQISHILLKNVLQFLDLETLLFSMRKALPNGFTCQIVQTINDNNQPDLFKLLYCLDFVKRVKKFYKKAEIVETVIEYGYNILDVNNKYIQTVLLDDWLNYHGVSKKQYYDTYKILSKLTENELNDYNIFEKDNKLYITRKLTIITFSC